MERTPYPVQCCFELTPRCNFNCRMCYVHLKPDEIAARGRELTASEWIRLGEQAVDAGTFFLTITGGEPLVRSDFEEIYTAFTEMGFWITLQTNLSLVDDKMMALLEERPPVRVKSTIYGATNETYEKVCGVKGGLDKVRRGIEKIQKAGIPVSLVSTVIRENEAELNDIHRLAAQYGLPLQHTHGVKDSFRNNNHDRIVSSRILYEDLTAEEQSQVKDISHPKISSPLELCGNYMHGGYWVLWDGRMSLCAHMEMDYYPLDSSIEQCYKKMIPELEKTYSKEKCECCSRSKECSACPAVLYLEKVISDGNECKRINVRRKMICDM